MASELDLVTLMRGAAGGDDWPWMATCLVKGANEIERLRAALASAEDEKFEHGQERFYEGVSEGRCEAAS